jgi:hypothetical protein
LQQKTGQSHNASRGIRPIASELVENFGHLGKIMTNQIYTEEEVQRIRIPEVLATIQFGTLNLPVQYV